jgi:hypothetical protein
MKEILIKNQKEIVNITLEHVLIQTLYSDANEISEIITDFKSEMTDLESKNCDCIDCMSEIPTPCGNKERKMDNLIQNYINKLKKIIL